MASEKFAVLALGPNNIRNNAQTARLFSSNIPMDFWVSTKTYGVQDCVEYNGSVYRSVAVNTNVIPGTDGTWLIQLLNTHDGDIAIAVSGVIDIRMRMSSKWISIAQRPDQVTLADNVVSVTPIFTYSASSFKDAFIDYEIARGNGNTEAGSLRIITDGTTNMNYSQEFIQLIGDPQVPLDISISAGNVVVGYTSSNQSSPITFKYSLRAW